MREVTKIDRDTFYALLTVFIATVQNQRNERVKRDMPVLHERAVKDGEPGYHICGYDDAGSRFVRVWDRSGGQKGVAFFVEKDTGIIFGSKSWKAYNPTREFGTLMTISEWNWEGYNACKIGGDGYEVDSLVPKNMRR